MAKFLDQLYVTEIEDEMFQVVDHPFRYESDVAKCIFTVPVGFSTDFASVPRFFPLIYALLGDTSHEPAVIHDWLYYAGITTRSMADSVLLEAMHVKGVPLWRRDMIYAGVRAGAWKAWEDHRKASDPYAGKFNNSPDILSKLTKKET